jgi:hypothetical protein
MSEMESCLPSLGSIGKSQAATRFGRTSGWNLHPLRQLKTPHTAAFSAIIAGRLTVGQYEAPRHVAVDVNLSVRNGQVKSRSDGPEPMCPDRLEAIRPSKSACASGPPTRLGVSASQNAVRFGRTSGWNLHPLRQIRTPRTAAPSATVPGMLKVGLCPARLGAIRPSRSACASGPPTRLGVSASQNAVRFGRTSGWNLHPLRQLKTPHTAAPKKLLSMRKVGLCLSRLGAIQPSRNACVSGPPIRFGVSASQASSARLVEPVGSFNHPLRQLKTPHKAAFLIGGEGGIRTHVPGLPDHLISSQRRYGHFGTSPDRCAILPAMQCIADIASSAFGYCR